MTKFGALAALLVCLAPPPLAEDTLLRWHHPDPSQVAGFHVYFGLSSRHYLTPINVGHPTPKAGVYEYTLTRPDLVTFVAITAYDAQGMESVYSNERILSPPTPDPPTEPPSGGVLFIEDFNGSPIGPAPAGWLGPAARNSMAPDSALFQVFSLSGNRVLGTISTQEDIHAHYATPESAGWKSYEYSGRMRMDSAGSGIGVTGYSDYPVSDTYYRLRRVDARAREISTSPRIRGESRRWTAHRLTRACSRNRAVGFGSVGSS